MLKLLQYCNSIIIVTQIKLMLLLLLLPVKLKAKNTWMVMNIYGNVHLLSHLN